MANIQKILENVLSHAYDPIKAHEYYIKTRELTGRQPGQAPPPPAVKSSATPAPSVNPNQGRIDEMHAKIDAQLADIENAMAPATKGAKGKKGPSLLALKDKADLTKLADDHKAAMEKLQNELLDQKAKLQRERYAKLDRLPPIPKGLPLIELRAMQRQRKALLGKIDNEYASASKKLGDKALADKTAVISTYNTSRDKIHTAAKQRTAKKLGGAVEAANGEYEKLKQDLARLLGRPT
jgi:hypothetical protein